MCGGMLGSLGLGNLSILQPTPSWLYTPPVPIADLWGHTLIWYSQKLFCVRIHLQELYKPQQQKWRNKDMPKSLGPVQGYTQPVGQMQTKATVPTWSDPRQAHRCTASPGEWAQLECSTSCERYVDPGGRNFTEPGRKVSGHILKKEQRNRPPQSLPWTLLPALLETPRRGQCRKELFNSVISVSYCLFHPFPGRLGPGVGLELASTRRQEILNFQLGHSARRMLPDMEKSCFVPLCFSPLKPGDKTVALPNPVYIK